MKNKGYKKNIFKAITITFTVGFIVCAAALVYILGFSPEAVAFEPERLISINGCFELFDNEGKLIPESIPVKAAKKASLSELPNYVKNAFVAVEDKRFYEHNGVDGIRIFGAIKNNILSGRFKEGASTITQQLVKNVYLSGKKNLSRKLNEIRLAKEVEKHYTKDEILEIYLNTIYFGNNAYGIEAASQTYFDKPSSMLTVSQAAVLAGMIKAPTSYAPNNDLEKCSNRRNTVLSLMEKQGYITKSQYETALHEEIDLSVINRNRSFYKRYMHGAIQEVCKILGITEKQLSESKLKIYTYYDGSAQAFLQDVLENNDVKTQNGSSAQSCGILLDNKTLGITAFCGYGTSNLYLMKRNIGSCVKPIGVYAPALNERIITPATAFNDLRRSYGKYSPKNYNDRYYGLVTVREAVSKSLNSISVLLMNDLTPEISRKYLSSMGIETDSRDNNLSLALGSFTYGVRLIDLTEAYACLANGGEHRRASFIRKITDEAGRVLYERKTATNKALEKDSAFLMTDMLRSVATEGTAKGLGKRLKFQIAAKTGTVGYIGSKSNSDALVVSYTSRHTLTLWLGGYDDDPLPQSVTGGGAPTILSAELYSKLYDSSSLPENFSVPSGITKLPIDLSSLREGENAEIADDSDGKSLFYEYFSTRNLPEKKRTASPIVKLSVTLRDGYPYIEVVTDDDCFIELHRVCHGKDIIIARPSGGASFYFDKDARSNTVYTYYAIPMRGTERGVSSESVAITVPKRKNNDDIFDGKWWSAI